jgi:hypothetical protein
LSPVIEERRAQRSAERAKRTEEARLAKQRIAEEAERLAAGHDWRTGSDRMRELLEEWKSLGRVDKATDGELWHRFSTARTTYSRRRKVHFAEQGAKRDAARATKEAIVAEAEALSSSTSWRDTSQAYRDLMTRWKAAGPARRSEEDKLWARFRAAQDAFFGARDSRNAEVDKEFSANAETKRALLAEAEKLLPVANARSARETFREIAARWDRAGKVPRADIKELEGRLKNVDQAIREAEDDRWRRSNPEARARAEATVTQLKDTIADLESQLARIEDNQPESSSRKASELRESIAARRQWLDQAQSTLADFS